MRLVNNDKIPNLDLYIQLANAEIVVKKTERMDSKENEVLKKRILKLVIPALILLSSCIFTSFSFLFSSLLATIYYGGGLIYYRLKDGLEYEQNHKSEEETKTREASYYYQPEFKEYMEATESKDTELYRKTVEAQIKKNQIENEILGLDETVSQLAYEIDEYYYAYKLPKSVITNREWDSLFDSIFEIFKEKEITNVYYQSMAEYVRTVLALNLVLERKTLSLSDFTENLSYLKKIITHTTPVVLSKKELDNLKIKIESSIEVQRVRKSKKAKVVNFNDHARKLK